MKSKKYYKLFRRLENIKNEGDKETLEDIEKNEKSVLIEMYLIEVFLDKINKTNHKLKKFY